MNPIAKLFAIITGRMTAASVLSSVTSAIEKLEAVRDHHNNRVVALNERIAAARTQATSALGEASRADRLAARIKALVS